MMVQRINKQKMKYSLFVSSTPIYQTDDDGNIVYMEIGGQQVPIPVGEKKNTYATPVDFEACITSELNELHMKSYGVDQSAIYSKLVVQKGYIPLTAGSLIWRESAVEWEDAAHTIPKSSSADYVVCGIMTEGLTTDHYLLQRKTHED